MGCIMIGIVDACEKYFYDELKSLKSRKFYFKQKKLARLLETPFEKIDRDQRSTLIAYAFHLHCRLLPLGVRHRVIECSGVKCPDEVKLGYEQLKEELENGSDLMSRLSTRIKQIDYSDGMFADWGITHFHLGKKSKNRVERTGPIAYAYLVRDEAYIIMIGEHGRWSDQAIFDKLLNEHPHLGEMHNIGVSPSAVADTAAKDRPKFRKEYINTFTKSGAVGVGALAFWTFFGDGDDGGVAIDGCAGGEDDVFAAVFLHDVDEYEDAVHVCFVVCQWLGY